MATRDSRSFGELLKQYRLIAGLTQEGLAERAQVSAQTISALERGVTSWPYRDTVGLLARALGLAEAERATLAAAARRRGTGPRRPREGAPQLGAGPDRAQPPAPGGAASIADLPGGTLTFLLTDIEDSTALWERHPAAMQAAIARHDALLDALLGRYGGRQVKERGEGDRIFAVFPSASGALAAVCALQQALLAEPWPAETPLRVRIALHSGEAALREGSYYGTAVNRAARLRALAHAGQVLLSQATHDLLRDALPEGVGLRALGRHRLKGLDRPEEVYQVCHPALPADFPPLPSALAPPTNLPVQATSFVGREREQGEVLALGCPSVSRPVGSEESRESVV